MTRDPIRDATVSPAECNHPSYAMTALGATCSYCGATGIHLVGGGIGWPAKLKPITRDPIRAAMGGKPDE
jgi:hypothetical protein